MNDLFEQLVKKKCLIWSLGVILQNSYNFAIGDHHIMFGYLLSNPSYTRNLIGTNPYAL